MMRGTSLLGMLIVLCLFEPHSATADDLQSWTEVEIGVFESEQITWTIRGVTRIRDSLGSVYDRRANTVVDFTLTDLVDISLGYVLRNRTRSGFGYHWDHRLLMGVTYPILRRGVTVKGTTLYERHIGRPDVSDFNRYRQQIEVECPDARVSPWFYQSIAFVRRGFVRSRLRVGIRWRFPFGHSFKGAYQFESIKYGIIWLPRHTIYSEWSF